MIFRQAKKENIVVIIGWVLLFPCFVLIAQSNDESASATALYQEGMSLLKKEDAIVFDKLKALEKFLKSQRILEKKTDKDTLHVNNEINIQTLFNDFIRHQNSDSLLLTTSFFPDSIFQANSTYSTTTKSTIETILTLLKNEKRNAFFKLPVLRYPASLLREGVTIPIITFENYWALEVIQFEKWLKNKEYQWRSHPLKIKQKLVEVSLQNKLLKLQKQENKINYENSKSIYQKRMAKAENEVETANTNYLLLKKVGVGILSLLFLLGYFLHKKNNQLLKRKHQSLLEEKKRSEDLLTNILPPEVIRELKRKGTVKAQQYETVSVFFSDFKNFSQIAETLSPEELVSELNYCFMNFDQIIDKYRLQKIKTIGDAYMCVGGLYTRGEHHIYRMVFAALEIQQFLEDRKKERIEEKNLFFEARIGIHTGPIVAGVIGSKKIAFDIWGDTVNVAQQMEHHSKVNKVNISGETFHRIKDQFACTQRETLTAKNGKEYDMFYVDKIIKA